MTLKQKLIVIVGPTASGKSEFAVKLAKKINGEIISADSRQIYRGLDIGTGKVLGKWIKDKFIYKGIVHHCIDFVSPKNIFTAAEYKKCAQRAIEDIMGRGKTPILVGGTGFWIDAVVFDLKLPEVPPNLKLRKKFEKKSSRELLEILKKLDPRRAKTVEQKNPRRLIRAIEIAKALGRVPVLKKREHYQATWIGIDPDRKTLEKKITHRASQMLKRGLVREVKNLLKKGITKKRIKEFGFEYKTVLDYLDKKVAYREIRSLLVRDTLRYARRQMTWFKRNKEIKWTEKTLNL